jgi:hypothetical protein
MGQVLFQCTMLNEVLCDQKQSFESSPSRICDKMHLDIYFAEYFVFPSRPFRQYFAFVFHLSTRLYTDVLISTLPDLLPEVFSLMVRIFRLILVLLYIYIYIYIYI